VSRCN